MQLRLCMNVLALTNNNNIMLWCVTIMWQTCTCGLIMLCGVHMWRYNYITLNLQCWKLTLSLILYASSSCNYQTFYCNNFPVCGNYVTCTVNNLHDCIDACVIRYCTMLCITRSCSNHLIFGNFWRLSGSVFHDHLLIFKTTCMDTMHLSPSGHH